MNQFNQSGFTIFDQPVIDPLLLRRAKSRIGPITRGEFDTGNKHWGFTNADRPQELQRIAQIHLCDQGFYDLLTQSNIGELIAETIGAREIKVWGTQLYIKPPNINESANVGWHRDSQHIPFYTSGLATVWIPLDGCDSHDGALSYVVGSHNKDQFDTPVGAQQQDLSAEQLRLCEQNESQWQSVDVEVPQGGMSIHHWDLIHGSNINRSDKPRYGLSIGIATEDLKIDPNHYDYGYIRLLSHPRFCPTLYSKEET